MYLFNPARPPRARAAVRNKCMLLCCVAVLCGLSGCQQYMANQPKQTPLSASDFFDNGSARPLVEGTVPRGQIEEDFLDVSPASDGFPVPVTSELLARGKERFEIYCSVCHGYTGEGDGMIVRRGFTKPPSYMSAYLRDAPTGHFYAAMTYGYGMMPSYAAQIPRRDRWAIIAYIRALQLSQYAVVSQLPAQDAAQIPSSGSPATAPTKPRQGAAR